MVKSKKLSRGSLAVLLLALMLALSMVVGITGAWFTSSVSKVDNTGKKFGEVTIALDAEQGDNAIALVTDNVAHAYLSGTDVMPGDTITYNYSVTNQKDAAHIRVEIVAAFEDGVGEQLSASDKQLITAQFNKTFFYTLEAHGAANNADHIEANVSFLLAGASFLDVWEGAVVKLSLYVDAIQAANVTMDAQTGALSTASGNGAVAWPASHIA